MIEPIMIFGLGFLAASLAALVILPLVHGRAVRLTTKRLAASTPVSIAEIQADKDQLRAEFAISTRRLEMSVEQLKGKTSGQLADIGKKTEIINKLKAELGEKSATIFSLETREKALSEQLDTTRQELGARSAALHETERKLAEKEAELASTGSALAERSMLADGQRVEIVALNTQIAMLKDEIADLKHEVKETAGRFERAHADAEKAGQDLAEERGKAENLSARLREQERQLTAQTAETDTLRRRAADLESKLAEQAGRLADANGEREQLKRDLDTARRIETELQGQLAALERRHSAASEGIRQEKARAESQIEQAREERGKAQRELATLKHEAETTWASERTENAMLRERINDVAAEVARLTVALEGPGSPIETILAADEIGTAAPVNGAMAKTNGGGSLADRIRALQNRAPRASAAR